MTRISLLSLATSEQRTDPSLKRNLLFKLPFWSNTRTSWWYLSIMISTNRLSSWSVLTPQTSSSANRRLRGWKERKKIPFSSKILTIWSPLSTTMKCPSLFMAMSCATFNFFSFSGPWPNDHGKRQRSISPFLESVSETLMSRNGSTFFFSTSMKGQIQQSSSCLSAILAIRLIS